MSTTRHHHFIDTIDEVLYNGVKKGVFHLYTGKDALDGRIINVNDQNMVNFGSCSYFGLETDSRLKQGTIDAVLKYGTQLSASRTYLSCGLYLELEEQFNQLFGGHTVIAPTTTLAHLSSMPVIINDNDAIILDQQVHASVQNAVQLTKLRGVRVEMIRHSNLDELENLIKELRNNHSKIWYMIDGVYSMYGDYAPLQEINTLMNKYEQFHLYVDDAHGMSWQGENGRGFTLNHLELNPKLVVVTSLAKAFGTGGGVMVFHDAETARKVKTCGSTLIFSGPIQPPMLGASIASAKIHLSKEITGLQEKLQERIVYINQLVKEYELPTVMASGSPIFFICMGMPSVGYNIGKRLMNEGLYVNLAIFPAVPVKKTGIRFTATLHQTKEDIKKLIEAIHFHFPKSLEEEGQSRNEVQKVFNLALVEEGVATLQNVSSEPDFIMQHETSIQRINKDTWDSLFLDKGAFGWDQMNFLENAFCNNAKPQHNWNFHYYVVKDKSGRIKLATFFTSTLCKDDIFSAPQVSLQIEKERAHNPDFLVSRCFMMGSILSVGEHLYIDRSGMDWKIYMNMLLTQIAVDQESEKASILSFRDFSGEDNDLNQYFLDKGFMKINIPDTHAGTIPIFQAKQDFLKSLKSDYRYFVNKNVFKHENEFQIEIVEKLSAPQAAACANLYSSVTDKKREINVFDFQENFFDKISGGLNMEFILLSIKPEVAPELNGKIIGFALAYKTENTYCFMLTGMDYQYLEKYSIYAQILWQIVARANDLRVKYVNLGLTASQNKRKFGFAPLHQVAYVQANDNFNMEVIGLKSVLNTNNGMNNKVA